MITRDLILDDALKLGVEPEAVLAVAEVESNGSGFLSDGRPVILFEALWFHKLTGGKYDQTNPTISSPIWDRSLYRGGKGEWDRYNEAYALNPEAAMKSASWGAFQIMGFNYAQCGFGTVAQFVSLMTKDLNSQIEIFTAFIQNDQRLREALRMKDWTTFARLYNGDGQVAYYAAKISDAYKRYAGKDTTGANAPIANPDIEVPPAYVVTQTGNVVMPDVSKSSIVKDSDTSTKVLAGIGSFGTAAGAFSWLANVDYKVVLSIGLLAVLAGVAFAIWKNNRIKAARVAMSKDGVA